MKTMIKTGAAVLTAALFAGCNTQVETPCAVGHGGYAAELIHVGGDTDGACFRTGDIIGVQKYRQESGNPMIYLKPESISSLDWYVGAFVTGDMPVGDDYTSLASGTLESSLPAADGFCSANVFTEATGTTILGETLNYQFSNVRFYNGPGTPGTQFTADLTITDDADCSASYRVNAMYPVIFCNNMDVEETDPAFGTANEELCHEADHQWSHVAANPFFASKCSTYGNPETAADADWWLTGSTPWLLCVPDGEIPALVD